MIEKFKITGMTCSACSAHGERAVSKLDGIDTVNVNLLTGDMNVTFNEKVTARSKAVEGALNALSSVKKAKVDLDAGNVTITLKGPIDKSVLCKTIADVGIMRPYKGIRVFLKDTRFL